MSAVVSITQSEVFTEIRSFIQGLVNCEVIQGLGNGVPMPTGGFICITPLYQDRLSTNLNTFTDPVSPALGSMSTLQATQFTIQIDCYGPNSAEWALAISTMFRDDYGCLALAPKCQPLYADNPRMIPLIDGEQQYEQRWAITALVQYNPVVTGTGTVQFFDVPTTNITITGL
jgi:hypothetical protein